MTWRYEPGRMGCNEGWPDPYIYTLNMTVYLRAVYDCVFGHFPAKNTVCTPYMHGTNQP
jgi:hypothetical protein